MEKEFDIKEAPKIILLLFFVLAFAMSLNNAFSKKETNLSYTINNTSSTTIEKNMEYFKSYKKPADDELKKILTPIQYNVTQKEGTETPFNNEYNSNKSEGIFVDTVSGEPLFSSIDKYDSGTGWPSFVKPISNDAIILKEDKKLFSTRTEVRSKYADSHLGHKFPDGPKDRGGQRYCMNSAAMRFIAKENMEKEGYGEYLNLFK